MHENSDSPPIASPVKIDEAIQASVNGHVTTATPPAEAPKVHTTLLDWVQFQGIQLLILFAFFVVAVLALSLYGLKQAEALGFSAVFTIVVSMFTRSLVPHVAEMVAPKLAAKFKAEPAPSAASHQPIDSTREIVETVVFVIVLVLLLRSYTAEAFVIPTGSMAESLYGYQKLVTCPQCKLEFPVNCSSEVDPQDGPQINVEHCTCPSCRLAITLARQGQQVPPAPGVIRDPGWNSGDRVLVSKFTYDLLDRDPDRLDVVVFKFPGDSDFPRKGPVNKHTPMNYIKRCVGLSGETIAIHRGKLWRLAPDKGLSYDDFHKAKGDPKALAQLWQFEYLHHNDDKALQRFAKGDFEIVRKNPANLLSMRRIVYDNDHQAKDLTGPEHQRWLPADKSGWSPVTPDRKAFAHDGSGKSVGWLRYRHVLRNAPDKPQLITDFMGYNTWGGGDARHSTPGENWASDLMVECDVAVETADGTFALELSRGKDRFQAIFDLSRGACTLYRITGDEAVAVGTQNTKMKGKGTYNLRFANMDDRLIVWVNEALPFGNGVEYGPVRKLVPTKENDLDRPVSVGCQGAKVQVSKVKVYRDTYYTTARDKTPQGADVRNFSPDRPETWGDWAEAPVSTYYVQPGHYLCLGDNSPESSDGRSWGLVPKRLLLGRALLVYFPFPRAGRIR